MQSSRAPQTIRTGQVAVARRSESASGGLHDRMIYRARAIGQAGMDVFAGEIGEVGQQFLDRHGRCQRAKHVADAHPGASDNRPATADIGVDDDARGHGWSMCWRGGSVKSRRCYWIGVSKVGGYLWPGSDIRCGGWQSLLLAQSGLVALNDVSSLSEKMTAIQ